MSGLLNSAVNDASPNLPDTTARPFGTSFSAQSASSTPGFHHAGSVQGLHNLHGSFNISNMSRNSTMNGVPSSVQQSTGSLSNGRFTSNNIPVALSQISHGSTNRGMGVSPIPRITSSIGNIIGGGNIGRNLNSGGGLTMPGIASRLNLSTNSVQGPNRLMGGGVLPQAPQQQVMSMLGGSMGGMLNDLGGTNENTAPFDINDFPRLSNRPGSAGGPQGQLGSMRKQGVSSLVQQNQEFSIQNEDFPALPGFKGGNDFSMDMQHHHHHHHQKDQLHDNIMQQSQQHYSMGRSSGFTYPSHQQQNSSNNNQDLLHLHNSTDLFSSSPQYHQNGGGGGSRYEQLMQQYQQQIQTQNTQFRLQQQITSAYRDQNQNQNNKSSLQTTTNDPFGLLGLLSVIRMSDPDLTSLALGIDLTTLGLNLNSGEDLHKKFVSPWSDGPVPKGSGPEYRVPECYYAKQPPVLHQGYFSKFKPQTLFYIFYSMPRDEAQLYAANELSLKGWFYHKELRIWFTRVPNMEPLVKTNTYERGSYLCFDPSTWEIVRKDNFVLYYQLVEKRPALPQH